MIESRRTVVIGALGAFVVAPFLLLPVVSQHNVAPRASAATVPATPNPKAWIAVAPGRVEPRGGEIRIGAETPGRIVDVLVGLNDSVAAGDLLAKLDDSEAAARLAAAAADVAMRKQARDNRPSGSRADRRQKAEDAAADSEQRIYAAREALDRARADERAGKGEPDGVSKARGVLGDAERQFVKDRAALAELAADRDMPPATMSESALTSARAQMALAQVGFERTRIRAPSSGTVLQVGAKVGELTSPSSEQSLFVIGDLSALRVRVEIEERDIDQVRTGQKLVVRADGFKGREFPGIVTAVAGTLSPARFASRGARRQIDQDVLEVFATLDGVPPLVSGMRVDVFFAAKDAGADLKP